MAYGERDGHVRPVVDLADRQALERWQPADAGIVEEARQLKEAALLDFGLTESAVASWLYAKCHHQIATTAVETAAVVASGDGTCLLLYNPRFFVDLGLDGVKFVLFHEARHLVHRHLFAEPELREDPVFTLAAEVSINHVAMVRLGRDSTAAAARRADRHRSPRDPRGLRDGPAGPRPRPRGVLRVHRHRHVRVQRVEADEEPAGAAADVHPPDGHRDAGRPADDRRGRLVGPAQCAAGGAPRSRGSRAGAAVT